MDRRYRAGVVPIRAAIRLSVGAWFYRADRTAGWRLAAGNRRWKRSIAPGLTGGYAHPSIVILNFRLESGRRRSLALLPDAADAEALRRLRVWLRTRQDEDEPDQP